MQRVAIARALVNDPDILLADEPTGALDSKTSVEVMELIKEIAKERLVIMVTHNGELAEEYASRIVRLKDGLVESDSNPYVGDMVSPKRANKAQKEAKRHRSKMSLLTSLGLSFRNLLTKKGRTIVTSIAGSIGIISVCLVLALSNGFQAYIRHTEEDMLSSSPIEISETALDISSVMSAMRSPADMPTLEELHDEIYVNSFLTSLAQGITVQNNISNDYVEYLDQGIEKHSDWFSAIRYDYGEVLDTNLFTPLITGGIELDGEMQPLQERNFSVARLKEYLIDELTAYAPEYGGLLQYVGLFENIINKMPGTADFTHPDYAKYVLSQYDILGEGHFPTNEHEAVLAVGEDNSLLDLTLVQLGFLTEAEFLGLFNLGTAEGAASVSGTPITLAAEGGESDPTRRSYERIYEQDYILYYNDAVYEDNVGAYPYKYNGERTGEFSATEQEGLEFKITAILRLKENFTYGCLSSGLNLTEAAIDTYIAHNAQSRIAQTIQKSAMDLNGITIYLNSPAENLNSYYSGSFALPGGMSIAYDRSGAALRAIGGNAKTNDVFIYPVDFDAKEHVLEYLDAWNEVEGRLEEDKITYTDRVGLMMGMVQTMLDVITYVLVAFTAISLVVSSVMIGIITYVSVVERIKEIGVLRSLGARKQDIRNLFNAETFIIGLTAGLIGIGVTYVIAFIVSMIIESLSGIAGIATLPVSTAVIMVLVSVILTLISGLIPAQAAAKKDPVIALRTE
ncbi:MAG: FtsX-like permease family protein [Clostridia bacterium]|nr:FtsX-like permease family protein [Clostridia bacterium]